MYNILIVEDSRSWSLILKEAVQGDRRLSGRVRVDIADNVVRAQEQINQQVYHLLIVDPALPDVPNSPSPGCEGVLLLNLLERRGGHIPPAILVSASPRQEIRAPLRYQKIVAYHYKPSFDIDEFVEDVCSALQEGSRMLSQDTLLIGILLEATKFLFSELGQQLDFWRKQKGEGTRPSRIEFVESEKAVRFDDIKQAVQVQVLKESARDIQACQKRIAQIKERLRIYRDEEVRATDAAERARIRFEISQWSDKLDEESEKLQELLERVYE